MELNFSNLVDTYETRSGQTQTVTTNPDKITVTVLADEPQYKEFVEFVLALAAKYQIKK